MYTPRAHLRKGALKPHYCCYFAVVSFTTCRMNYITFKRLRIKDYGNKFKC